MRFSPSPLSFMLLASCSSQPAAENSAGGEAGTATTGGASGQASGASGAGTGATTAIGGSSVGASGAGGAGGQGGSAQAGAATAGDAGTSGGASDICVRPTDKTTGVTSDALSPQTGMVITQANATLENLELTGDVAIAASNVTLRNCRIHGHVTVAANATGALIEDSEIIGPASATSAAPGVGTHDFTLRRVHLRGFTVFVRALSGQMRIERSLFDAPCSNQPNELVTGVAGYVPGPGSLDIYCNAIDMKKLDAACSVQIDHSIQLNHQDDPAKSLAVTIDQNFLDGGNYSVNLEQGFKSLTISNNRWGRAAEYGPALVDHLELISPADLVWENNVFDDDGTLISRP